MAIHRDKNGLADDWHLDKVIMVTGELELYSFGSQRKIDPLRQDGKTPEPIRLFHQDQWRFRELVAQ